MVESYPNLAVYVRVGVAGGAGDPDPGAWLKRSFATDAASKAVRYGP
jgi:hypothetical protein